MPVSSICWSRFSTVIAAAVICLILLATTAAFTQQDNRALAKQALDQALRATDKQILTGDRSALRRRIALLTSRLDPAAAAEICKGISVASDAIRARGEVSSALASADRAQAEALVTAAVSLLRDLAKESLRLSELSYLSIQLARFDPQNAFRSAREIKDPALLEYTWGKIARRAPRAALEDLKANPSSPPLRFHQIAALLPALAAEDLLTALSLSEEITDPLIKSQALAELSFSLPPGDALGVAQRIPDESLHSQAIFAAAQRLASTDPAAALAAIGEVSANRDSALAAVALAASTIDLEQALGLISQITSPHCRQDALGLLLIDLSARNLPAARELVNSHAEIPSWALPAFCAALAQSDTQAALEHARAITDSSNRTLALLEIARAAATSSSQIAEDLLLEVEEPAAGGLLPALRALVLALALTDLEKATALTTLAADAGEVHFLLLDIARVIAPQDPARALRLIKPAPPSPEKSDAILDIAAFAALKDMKQGLSIASSVLSERSAGHALAARLISFQPSLAVACANEIKDPLQRAYAFCDIAEALLAESGGESPPLISRPEIQRVVEPGGLSLVSSLPGQVEILSAQPHQLKVRLPAADPGLYTLRYQGPGASFIWENLQPAADGTVVLKDDRHLQPGQRLRCPSRGTVSDPAFFDDFTKANLSGKQRLPYGIPVSTFGGPGYLCSAPTWLHRDSRGNFWLYQDIRPWRITSFDSDFNYRFSLVFPTRIIALDSDAEANPYLLQEGNLLSRFDPDGRPLSHWKLKEGRGANEFIEASGLAIDPAGEYLYLADKKLGRVQRFTLQMRPAPFHFFPWGWIGREDLSYLELGAYRSENKYRLDRPGRLLVGPDKRLYVDCAYYLMRFDLNTGEQVPFRANEVLGWGATFTDSPHSISAAANGHWEEHRLAGLDPQGNIYISDTANAYLRNLRLQRFSPEGEFIAKFDVETKISDAEGSRAYIVPPLALPFAQAAPEGEAETWLAEGGGRIYEGPALASGGRFHLGPGAPGKQFDLTLAEASNFTVEKQNGWVSRKMEGEVLTYNPGRRDTRNCEAERNPEIPAGASSIWIPVRLGEPFRITLFEGTREISLLDYNLEIETQPGPFGTGLDFFRVTNKSGRIWKSLRFLAETLAP